VQNATTFGASVMFNVINSKNNRCYEPKSVSKTEVSSVIFYSFLFSMFFSVRPTFGPSRKPSPMPSKKPSRLPSVEPTSHPTAHPTAAPTSTPTVHPTSHPSVRPTAHPSIHPTPHPTNSPKPKKLVTTKSTPLNGGQIAGIVLFVLCLVLFYVYFYHRRYLQRFVDINISGYKLFLEKTRFGRGRGRHHPLATQEQGIGGNDDEDDKKSFEDEIDNIDGKHNPDIENNMKVTRQNSEDSLGSDISGSINSEVRNPLVATSGSASSPRRKKGKRSQADDDTELESGKLQPIKFYEIAKSGWLYKQSTKSSKKWLKRWFFIKSGSLYYSHSSLDFNQMSTGLTIIPAVLVANLVISTVKPSVNEKNTFTVISPGLFFSTFLRFLSFVSFLCFRRRKRCWYRRWNLCFTNGNR
jgi:hypothetical protein